MFVLINLVSFEVAKPSIKKELSKVY